MIRLACIVLAIAFLPSQMDAQGLTGARTHTVTRVDTLSEIAARYLGAASDWGLVFDTNWDRLTDPNVLQEGMQQTPVFSVSVLHSAGRLLPEGEHLDLLGQITRFADARGSDVQNASGLLYQHVYIRFSDGGSPQVGEAFCV